MKPPLHLVPSDLIGQGGLIEDNRTPAQRAADRFAETKRLAEQAARLALGALSEGALQASEVSGAPTGQMLNPAAADALRRVGEYVAKQVDLIGRMI